MREVFSELKNRLDEISNRISDTANERQGYLNTAGDIQKIYDKLAEHKKAMKNCKKAIESFYESTYTGFKGDNFKYTYKPSVKDLINSYSDVITKIDNNLDALNRKKLENQNKASECLGFIGYLESAYNSIATQIQNRTN